MFAPFEVFDGGVVVQAVIRAIADVDIGLCRSPLLEHAVHLQREVDDEGQGGPVIVLVIRQVERVGIDAVALGDVVRARGLGTLVQDVDVENTQALNVKVCVVPGPAEEGVVAGAAVENVAAGNGSVPGEGVVAVSTGDEVVAVSAG